MNDVETSVFLALNENSSKCCPYIKGVFSTTYIWDEGIMDGIYSSCVMPDEHDFDPYDTMTQDDIDKMNERYAMENYGITYNELLKRQKEKMLEEIYSEELKECEEENKKLYRELEAESYAINGEKDLPW
jgi:hypothetical protein